MDLIDRVATHPYVVTEDGAKVPAEGRGVAGFRLYQWFEVASEYQELSKLRAKMREVAGHNELDEVIIRRDDGALCVLYVDEASEAMRVGRRFVSDEVEGDIVSVLAEWDTPTAKEVGLAAAGVIVLVAGIIGGAVVGAGSLGLVAPAGYALAVGGLAAGSALLAKAAGAHADGTRDPHTYDSVRGEPQRGLPRDHTHP